MFFLLAGLAGIVSCSKDDDTMDDGNNDDCSSVDITYNNGIKAIIDANCALPACHGGDPTLPDFTIYDNIFARRSLVQSRVVGKSMPPSGSTALSSDNIQKINCWVENGAPQ